jgi:hypothetical protein
VSLTLHHHTAHTVGPASAGNAPSRLKPVPLMPLIDMATGCLKHIWRVAVVLILLTLSGCLVTFTGTIPAHDIAPPALLGTWTSRNAWGEPLELEISRVGEGRYRAVSYRKGDRKNRDEYSMTVAEHHGRWYLSTQLPDKYGGHFVMGGFELIEDDQMVVYSLDPQRFKQWVEQKALSGQKLETDKGEVLLIDSPLEQVFGYLDDPANSDVFLDAAHYQRVPK